jgi:hypothetical protein
MPRCFLTGVQFPLLNAYVLNRREAFRLVRALEDRARTLRRVIAQLSPLDEAPRHRRGSAAARPAMVHRLVCRAVADALAGGFPEIRLLLPWPEYLLQARVAEIHFQPDHPRYGEAIRALTDEALAQAVTLGRRVMRSLDPQRRWPPEGHTAVTAGICVRHHTTQAVGLVRRIRALGDAGADPDGLGLHADEREFVRAGLLAASSEDAPAIRQGTADAGAR